LTFLRLRCNVNVVWLGVEVDMGNVTDIRPEPDSNLSPELAEALVR